MLPNADSMDILRQSVTHSGLRICKNYIFCKYANYFYGVHFLGLWVNSFINFIILSVSYNFLEKIMIDSPIVFVFFDWPSYMVFRDYIDCRRNFTFSFKIRSNTYCCASTCQSYPSCNCIGILCIFSWRKISERKGGITRFIRYIVVDGQID